MTCDLCRCDYTDLCKQSVALEGDTNLKHIKKQNTADVPHSGGTKTKTKLKTHEILAFAL